MCITSIITWYKKWFCETNTNTNTMVEDDDSNSHYKKYDENPMHCPVPEVFDAEVYWKSYDDKFSIFVPQTTDSHITDSL